MYQRKLFCLILFILLTPLRVWSEKEKGDSTFLPLEEVVVSATRWEQIRSSLPQRLISVSPEAVRLYQPQTTADLLANTGQVFVQKSQQGGGSPMIRGFATHRLLYAVDGVRMNTAIFRGGNIQNVISIDPFSLQRTEVLFGPGSVIYGSDAIGGVMSFQTLTPMFSDAGLQAHGKAAARFSSANLERTGHFDINLGGKRWAWLGSVSYFHFDDLRQGTHGPREYLKPWIVETAPDGTDQAVCNPHPKVQNPSGYNQWNVMQKLRFQPTKAWDLQYAFHHSQTSDYGRYDRHTRLRKGLPRYAEWSYGPQIWRMNQFTVQHQSDNPLFNRATLRAAWQHFEESRIDRSFGKAIRTTQKEEVEAYSLNLDFSKAWGRHTLYYGVEGVCDDVSSSAKTTDIQTKEEGPAASRYPQAQWFSLAGYAQAMLRLHRSLTMELGMRYNHFALRADFRNWGMTLPFPSKVTSSHGAFSGGVGWAWQPNKRQRFTLHYARAFRSPNVDDMGKLFDSVDRAVVVPNPRLHAELAHHVEVGLEQRFGNWLQMTLTAFYTYLDDALVRRPFRRNGQDSILYKGEQSQVLALQNAAWAQVYGVQMHVKAQLPAGFEFKTFINAQKGKEQLEDGTSSPLRHAAPLFGRVSLNYRNKAWHAEFYTDFQARRAYDELADEERGKVEIYALDKEGQPYAPGWLTLNAKAAYDFRFPLTLHLGLENLTNRRYRPYSSGISAAGFNIMAAATYRF